MHHELHTVCGSEAHSVVRCVERARSISIYVCVFVVTPHAHAPFLLRLTHVPANSLPPSLGWLILSDNQLEVLPSTMGDLSLLRKCMLAGNKLKTIPPEMEKVRPSSN